MEQEIRLRLGLPKGSLNTPGRGDTKQVFIDAGYDIRGYESGKEVRNISVANDIEIKPFLIRPQGAAILLSRGMLDIAITGDDWIQEESVKGNHDGIRKIGDLEYGQTRLVLAVPAESNFKTLSDFLESIRGRNRATLCFTEYVNLTRQRLMQNEVYQSLFRNVSPLVQIRGLTDGQNRLLQIISSDGATEGFIDLGADIIADNVQSGDSLRAYGLREIEEIMKSSAGLYAGPSCTGWKERKAQEIFEQLQGAVTGKRYFDVKFNIPLGVVDKLREYLVEAGLCADEPTVTIGKQFAAVNILIPSKTYPNTLKMLRETYGASAVVRNEIKQYIK